MLRILLFGFSLFVLLCGCAALKSQSGISTRATLANIEARYLSNQKSGLNAFVLQKATITTKNMQQSFILQVEINSDKLAMAAVSSIGKKLFQAILLEQRCDYTVEPFSQLILQPDSFLLNYQLIYWPLPVVQADFTLTSTESKQDDGFKRSLFSDGRLIAYIQYSSSDPWSGEVVYHDIQQGYSLKLETLHFESQ